MIKLNKDMKIPKISKKVIFILIAVVLLIGLVIGGYLLWNNWKKSISSETKVLENAGEASEKIIEGATKGVLPSLGADPLQNKPDINPADKANPFKNIKTNPFD